MLQIRTTLLVLSGLCSFSCQREAPATLGTEEAAEIVPRNRRLLQLLTCYPEARLPLTLSTEGAAQDTAIMHPLPREVLVPDSLIKHLGVDAISEGNDVFAVGKLALSQEQVGLFTRVPGVYVPSKVKLLVLNTRTGKIEADYEVAETVGDAGASYVRTTDILRTADGTLQLKISQANCWPLDEELDNIKCVDSAFVYQLAGTGLRLLEKKKVKEY